MPRVPNAQTHLGHLSATLQLRQALLRVGFIAAVSMMYIWYKAAGSIEKLDDHVVTEW